MATYLGVVARLDHPVIDKTDLDGNFDFVLDWALNTNPSSSAASENDQSGPTFLEALKDQLGLKFDSATGATEVWVLDRVDPLLPN
jgi:uncharacterized protein (TIGR03435 family)